MSKKRLTIHSLLKYISSALLIFSIFASLFVSCKTTKKSTVAANDTTSRHLNKESARFLKEKLKQYEFHFEWISAKIAADAAFDSSRTSFNVSMRCRKDSAIWMSISPLLGIEVARALITKDSVKFIDRIHNEFFTGDFNFISKLLHTDLDFEMAQSILVGNSVDFYEEDEKLKSGVYDGKYLLSTVRRRKFKRVVEKDKELKEPVQGIWLDPSTFKIIRILFNEFNPDREFDANFSNFKAVDSLQFPHSMKYTIKAEKNVDIQLDYSKVTLNKPLSMPFSIPENYERVIYKGK